MAYVEVTTSRRRSMPNSRALRIWEAHAGRCVNCGEKIDGKRDEWFVEHIRALELGGEDVDANCGPAHLSCKAAKDADDHSRAAKAKRAKRKELGIRKPKGRPLPVGMPAHRATTPLEKTLPPRRSLYVSERR